MSKKYPYTEKYEREQLENLYVKKSKINRKKLILITFGTLIVLFILGIWNYRNEKHLINSGIRATGIISSIKLEYRRINDLDVSRIRTYSIEYKFLYNSDTVYGLDLIREEELNEYFDSMPRINDTIKILYDAKKNENSRIKKK